MGWYFLKMTFETAKFLSRRSIFSLNSAFRLDMSAHFLMLLKNWIRLSLQLRKRRVSDTPFPSTDIESIAEPPEVPLPDTVGKLEFRQATYKAHANQCNWLPSRV